MGTDFVNEAERNLYLPNNTTDLQINILNAFYIRLPNDKKIWSMIVNYR